jgi:hypothetical protein
MSQSVATYDVYFISAQLAVRFDGAKRAEIHSVAYLACLLSLFDGKSPDWWGYGFTSTEAGAPYAVALDDALELLTASGSLARHGQLFAPAERGREFFERLSTLPSLASRQRYLDPACGVTLALPMPTVTEAVVNEPQLHTASSLRRSRPLLGDLGLTVLQPHFEGLRSAMGEAGDDPDLLISAIVWLTYLLERARQVRSDVVD